MIILKHNKKGKDVMVLNVLCVIGIGMFGAVLPKLLSITSGGTTNEDLLYLHH